MKIPSLVLVAALGLSACGSVFQTHEIVPTVYELKSPPVASAPKAIAATLRIARPRTRPGLDSERIAVTLADRRLDGYGGTRWSAPLPALVESLLAEGFRASGGWQAVVPERSAFGGEYVLQPEIEAFEADYSAGGPPTVRVRLRAELGLNSDRRLIATLEGSAAVRATADRQREVIAAFESAYGEAAATLISSVNAAAAAAEAAPKPPG